MDVNFTIDWLRFTMHDTPIYKLFPLHNNLPQIAMHGPTIQPLPRYNLAALLSPAGRIDYGDPGQGTLVTFTGSDLFAMRLSGIDLREVCQHVASDRTAKVSRFDLCADILGAGAKAQDIADAWGAGQVDTRVKKMTRIESSQGGDSLGVTVYFGSRQSERFLRIYDKGLQLGAESENGTDWLRVEMECKGRFANAAVKRVAEVGEQNTLLGLLQGFLSVSGVSWWDNLTDREFEDFPELGRKSVTASDEWLHKVALPKVIEAANNGDAAVIAALKRWFDLQG